MARWLLSLLLAALLTAPGRALAPVTPFCEASLTRPKVLGCTECMAAAAQCYGCSARLSAIWKESKLTECRPLSSGAACQGVLFPVAGKPTPEKDDKCTWCETTTAAMPFTKNRCVRCIRGHAVSKSGKCAKVVGTLADAVEVCRNSCKNPNCAECHNNGECKRCAFNLPILSPKNAVYLDALYPESQCTTKATIAALAKEIAGLDLNVEMDPMCAELDTDFRCASCVQWTKDRPLGYGPAKTANPKRIKCVENVPMDAKNPGVPKNPASGCIQVLPFMQYCLQCDKETGRKCLECTGSRSVDPDGLCSFNCKGLFGISCKKCHAAACLEHDTTYKSG